MFLTEDKSFLDKLSPEQIENNLSNLDSSNLIEKINNNTFINALKNPNDNPIKDRIENRFDNIRTNLGLPSKK